MSAPAFYSSRLRRMSPMRYCTYILVSVSAVTCYYIVSTLTSIPISASSGLPLLAGYVAHTFFQHRLQHRLSFQYCIKHRLQHQLSLQYCVLLSAALLSLGDAARLIQMYFVADPDAMGSAHLAVTHFGLAFFVLSEMEYVFRTVDAMPWPDVVLTPMANMLSSCYNDPDSLTYEHDLRIDSRELPTAIFTRALVLDVAGCVLWQIGVWRFTSLLQAWLNPDFVPDAGVVYRPFATSYGFEVIWTSNGVIGPLLQFAMMRPIRILNSYLFACGADVVEWLRQL